MTIPDIWMAIGGLLGGMTLIQIVPIKINPWSCLAKALGNALNRDVLAKLESTETRINETHRKLEEHISLDDRRNADDHRAAVLRFNNELLRGIEHTKEEFLDICRSIDAYEHYCGEHEDYPNNRAENAIANINRVYQMLLATHGFLDENGRGEDGAWRKGAKRRFGKRGT